MIVEDRGIVLLLKRIHNRLEKNRNIYLRKENLTGAQMDLLCFLYYHKDKAVSQKDISAYLDIQHTSTIDILRNLERKQFISRVVNPENARYRLISITPKGEEVIAFLGKIRQQMDEILFAGFSEEELSLFASYLQRVYDNLEQPTARKNGNDSRKNKDR